MRPLIIESHGKKLLVLAFTDLDGTVNDQGVQEKYRLETIKPAAKAIETLQSQNIPVGIITARSFGETLVYQKALGAKGYTVTEDGAVIILPKHVKEDEAEGINSNKHIIIHDNQEALVLTSVDIVTIKKFLQFIASELDRQKSPSELISTVSSSPEVLKTAVNYETIPDARLAMDRLASAFVRNASDEQYRLLNKYASEWNIRISGKQHHSHILGSDADKGRALHFINSFLKDKAAGNEHVDGIFPIVFGNDYNDLALFEAVESMGGISVLVNDSSGQHRIATDDIPPYVIKTKEPNGYGMQEAIGTIFQKLALNY